MLILDADFPGGNILVESVDGAAATLRQDRRDTEGWWFYWCCRVRGADGRELTLRFTDGDVFTAMGPSFSEDGIAWRWIDRALFHVKQGEPGPTLTLRPPTDRPFFLSFTTPYTADHLRRFLARHPRRPELRVSPLTTSERGRPVERIELRDPQARAPRKVLLTARHHACECVADYVLEGILDFALEPATKFLQRIELLAIPFVDKDGVEAGDQGKNRRPHDHNRDYTDEPIYAATRAIIDELDGWADDRFTIAFDLHCPWIRGGRNDHIFLVEPPADRLPELSRFAEFLKQDPSGPLCYDGTSDIAFGQEWHTGQAPSFGAFIRANTAAAVGATLEFPYATAGGRPVTAAGARAFGRDFARAMLRYVSER
jgi:hypothetical protein